MDMGRGHVVEEISREFDQVLEDVKEANGTGELIIRIKVTPQGWDKGGNVREVGLAHSLSSKRPRRKVGASTFFVDAEGGLTRNNPDQMGLEFEEKPKKRAH